MRLFLLAAALLWAEDPKPPEKPPAPNISTADELLGQMRDEGTWSIVMMEIPGRKITFEFGELGKRVVELKWANERNASVGEVNERLNGIYEDGGGDFGSGKDNEDAVSGKKPGMSLARQAYTEMRRTVLNLNKGKFNYANNHLTLMESAAAGLPDLDRRDYTEAAASLRRANAIMGSDNALRGLVLAAERGDFTEREALKTELRGYAKNLHVNMGRFLLAASDIWEAYSRSEEIGSGPGGNLEAALQQIDVAEKLVQGRFKRGDYAKALERVRGFAQGLKVEERRVLAARLRKHAAMWSKAAADTLAFALMSSLSKDPAVLGRVDALLDQSKWKGRQAARSQNLAKALLKP